MFEPPIRPKIKVVNYQSKPYKYFQSIRPLLGDWWEEFKVLSSEGGYVYPSVKSFIYEKAKKAQERAWLLEAIGPEPQLEPDQVVKVPWLGDWYEIRLMSGMFPTQTKEIGKVLEASNGSTAESVLSMRPLAVTMIARHLRELEQLNDYFAGQLFDPKFPMTSEETSKRVALYFTYYDMVDKRIEDKIRLMQELNGLSHTKEGVQVVQFNQVNQQANVQLPDAPVAGELPKKEVELIKLARTLQYHSERLKLPLSEKLKPVEIKGEEVKDKYQ